jgi:hypothetical protein
VVFFEFDLDERKKELPSRLVDRSVLVVVVLPKRLD